MREILFRGKRIADGKWMYGLPSYDEYGNIEEIQVWDGEDISFCLVDPETICQYTGLTDKNGKKIWENDILSGYLDDDFPEAETRVLVLWQENGWCAKQLECNGYEKLDVWYSEYFEVIGNVVDNPKLLEV